MKIQLYRLLVAGLLQAGVVSALWAQAAVQPATGDWEQATLGKMTGQTIRASNDESISTVADYLIEPHSGQLRYAIVPSGSGAGGMTFRLVPMAALDPAASNSQSLKLRIDRAQWDRVGTLTNDWLRDHVWIDNEHRQRIAQQFSVSGALPGQGSTVELVRASSLKGRPLVSGQDNLGTISDVVIDVANKAAWALVRTPDTQPGGGRNYLFPLDRAEIHADRGAIKTSLTRNDFAAAQPELAPTGFSSSGQNMSGVVTAIQQATQNVAGVAPGNVQVVQEGRIVLRGTVSSEQQKAEVLRAASQAAPGVRVDSELTVRAPWMPRPFR
jgi:hypothetical protein